MSVVASPVPRLSLLTHTCLPVRPAWPASTPSLHPGPAVSAAVSALWASGLRPSRQAPGTACQAARLRACQPFLALTCQPANRPAHHLSAAGGGDKPSATACHPASRPDPSNPTVQPYLDQTSLLWQCPQRLSIFTRQYQSRNEPALPPNIRPCCRPHFAALLRLWAALLLAHSLPGVSTPEPSQPMDDSPGCAQ